MKLTLKQKIAGKTQAFEVTLCLTILHPTEREARSYIDTMFEDWGAQGRIIPCYKVLGIAESDTLFTAPRTDQVRDFHD